MDEAKEVEATMVQAHLMLLGIVVVERVPMLKRIPEAVDEEKLMLEESKKTFPATDK